MRRQWMIKQAKLHKETYGVDIRIPTNSDEEIESEEEALLSEQVIRMQRELDDEDQTRLPKDDDDDLVMGQYYKRLMKRSEQK